MSGVTTYGDISQRTAAFAVAEMLDHAEPILVLSKLGLNKPQPKNKSATVKFRRPIPFSAATTPVVEGVRPTAQQMAYEDVPATLSQYGAWVQITDKVADLNEDPVLQDATMLCGEQAAETIEMITWGALKAGTNKFFSNGAQRTEVNTVISLNKLHAIVRSLRAQRAKPITSILSGSPEYGTSPVEAAYVAVGHTNLEHDIRALAGFTPVAEYGQRKPLVPEELGSVENIRFILTPLLAPYPDAGTTASTHTTISTTGTNADVYPLIVLGQNAFGTIALKGSGSIVPFVSNPGKPTTGDELGQLGFVSWKTWFTAVVLNQAWMAVLETAATAL